MNRVSVTIAEHTYALLTDGDADLTQRIAQYVDDRLTELLADGKTSIVDASILCAMNITESYFKEMESAENLRRQLKEYLDESTKMKLELSEAKREIFKRKGGK